MCSSLDITQFGFVVSNSCLQQNLQFLAHQHSRKERNRWSGQCIPRAICAMKEIHKQKTKQKENKQLWCYDAVNRYNLHSSKVKFFDLHKNGLYWYIWYVCWKLAVWLHLLSADDGRKPSSVKRDSWCWTEKTVGHGLIWTHQYIHKEGKENFVKLYL